MSVEALVTLVVGACALLINISTLAVGYGVLRGTVNSLTARVGALETEMGALNDLKIKVAEIATRQETWIEQLKELNASIRWMREPAPSEPMQPPTSGRRRS